VVDDQAYVRDLKHEKGMACEQGPGAFSMIHGGKVMCRILVLDDDASIRLLYEDELTEEGYEVVTESNGSAIDELIVEKRPDLVLLDLKLGGSSGFEVLQAIRKEDTIVPVIFCTAYPVSPKEARAMGANDLVIKSSDLSELKLKIKKALQSNTSPLLLSAPALL
jgi:DNA-binding response OmpR family regulator